MGHIDVALYFTGLSYRRYSEYDPEDQKFLLESHRHLASCEFCNSSLDDLIKESMAESTPEAVRKIFSPKAFRLLRENQELLGELNDPAKI